MRRYLPALAFVIVALVGAAGATFLYISNHETERVRFEGVADEAVNRITARLARHLVLIDAAAAFIEARSGEVTPTEFATFAAANGLGERHTGIAGLGFAPLLTFSERPDFQRYMVEHYGQTLRIRPASTGQSYAAPVTFIMVTDDDQPDVLGFDMYSEPSRREAMERAAALRAPQASRVSRLATDTDASMKAFVVYAPLYRGGYGVPPRRDMATGYVVAGFRVADFLAAALAIPPFLPVNLTVTEARAVGAAEEGEARPIFTYGGEPDPRLDRDFTVEREIDVAGQTWHLTIRPTELYRTSTSNATALILGAVSLLFAAALAASLRAQAQTHAATERLAETMERNLFEKDLMLQEMNHRIKNSIARILAMARQTAARAESVEAFSESFTARLQAMAAAQDMLTRSSYGRADLRELLTKELGQVFGIGTERVEIEGPDVSLDEAATQALGLTFHELATNALKYGGGEDGPPALHVRWRIEGTGKGRSLVLDWRESGRPTEAPTRTGFGTRLIDANIRLELRGEITRRYGPDGLAITLRVPLESRGSASSAPGGKARGAPSTLAPPAAGQPPVPGTAPQAAR